MYKYVSTTVTKSINTCCEQSSSAMFSLKLAEGRLQDSNRDLLSHCSWVFLSWKVRAQTSEVDGQGEGTAPIVTKTAVIHLIRIVAHLWTFFPPAAKCPSEKVNSSTECPTPAKEEMLRYKRLSTRSIRIFFTQDENAKGVLYFVPFSWQWLYRNIEYHHWPLSARKLADRRFLVGWVLQLQLLTLGQWLVLPMV
jgi:hypothetical protein